MLTNSCPPELYAKLMQALKEENEEYESLLRSKEYKTGSVITRMKNTVKKADYASMVRFVKAMHPGKEYTAYDVSRKPEEYPELPISPGEYFSDERIAVYTCVLGHYDHIQEPAYQPDNVDYYIITDQELPADSRWQKISADALCEEGWTVSEKNRYCKMHPDRLFPDYRYSVYVDGNIKIISDLTPYVYRIGACGIAMHHHARRNCAYDELKAVQAIGKLDAQSAENYRRYLEAMQFPRQYGLAEGNVIVREHHNETCRKVMRLWWRQFRNRISRDQVSLPLVLYKLGIPMEEITTLGYDVYHNRSFRVADHIHKNE